jgi:hypothetical protein
MVTVYPLNGGQLGLYQFMKRSEKTYATTTSIVSGLCGKVLKLILEEEYKPFELEKQSSFRTGPSCIHNIFCLMQALEKHCYRNGYTCGVC